MRIGVNHRRLIHPHGQTALPQLDARLTVLGMDGVGQLLQLGDVLVLCEGEEHLERTEGVDGKEPPRYSERCRPVRGRHGMQCAFRLQNDPW